MAVPKYITNHAGKVMKDDKWVMEEILKRRMEMNLRCGDGTGEIPSHSIWCRCKQLQEEINQINQSK